MTLKIYDSKEVSIVFAGIPITGGFADGEFCRIEQSEQDFLTEIGTDGEVTRSKSNNQHAAVTITLMQSATINNALSALNNVDKKATNGAGVGPLLIKDKQGTSLYVASKSWIAAPPVPVFDRTAKAREWRIECADLERLDGGN